MKTTKSNKSKKPVATTPNPATTPAPTPAATAGDSTAEQAPAPQTTQAPTAATATTPATPLITGSANGSNNSTKTALQTSYAALIAGLKAYYQPGDVLQLPTGNETRDEVIADLQKFVQATEDTKVAYLAWRAAVQNERTIELALRPEKQAVQSVVVGRFGKTSTTLLTFGIQPKVPVVRTVAAKAESVAKGDATRKARGTKGSKQKLDVVGNVTGVVITPVTSVQVAANTTAASPAAETPASPNAAASPANAPAAASPAPQTPAVKPAS
jgi:hypothetical protein